jgi:integrase
MPIKLIPPRPGKTPYYAGRGSYLGVYVNERSTKTGDRRLAAKVIRQWERDIERGAFAAPGQPDDLTFADAALAYMQAGGERRYIKPLLLRFKETPIAEIDQRAIDAAAIALAPSASAATRNRKIYTPVSAVLHHAGSPLRVRRPKGWRGQRSTAWLEPEQAFAVFPAADKIDVEFGLLLRVLLYTGMRINEALGVVLRELDLEQAVIYLPRSKNGHARAVHLPPVLIAALAAQPPRVKSIRAQGGGPQHEDVGVQFLDRAPARRLFRFHKGGALVGMLKKALADCGLAFPPRQGGFHLFCHTYGTWMHRYGKLDSFGLARTDRWRDPRSADRYRHTAATEEARRADLLPTAGPKKKRR